MTIYLLMGGNSPNLYVALHRVAEDSELMRQENTEWIDNEMCAPPAR
ncbi:MAG: hypothetical protein ACPGWR_25715 [Ardenticatenaceae bacterium]